MEDVDPIESRGFANFSLLTSISYLVTSELISSVLREYLLYMFYSKAVGKILFVFLCTHN